MIVTLNWLKEFVDCKLSADELAHRLTMAGLEVESVEKFGEELDSVIVARLISVEKHPDAERLTLCQVDTGSEQLQIVCGATNHRAGDLVALAQVGSVLPGNFKIKKSKIRGQESMGMLCSEVELGLAESSEGIMILPPGLQLGSPVFDVLKLKDVRYEIGLTPNRPDCLSIVGVAREVAAMQGAALRLEPAAILEGEEGVAKHSSVSIEEPGLCPRYAARLIRGVKIGPSPDWMVRRLESLGLRSINNVVDVTNYVLMELGHPLHAFDYNLLRGRRIVVKRADEGAIFKTLDGQERALLHNDLVICDAEGPVALAGIMGGENSEICDQTVDVLLESAYFNPSTIRRTSKRLGLRSESSHRFERGADVNMVPFALDRAAELIREIAGGEICRGRLDCYPQPVSERKLSIDPGKTSRILGLELDVHTIKHHLQSIGLETQLREDADNDTLQVMVPTFRPDLEREIDLIEEVARLNGYDHIPTTMPVGRMVSHRPAPRQALMTEIRNAMVAGGYSEVVNYSFISPASWDKIGLEEGDLRRNPIKILNPLTEEQSVMRTTLVPSLLETVSSNLAYRTLDLRLFELRPVFLPREDSPLALERPHLTAVLTGQRHLTGWGQKPATADFYDLKGVAEDIFDLLQLPQISWEPDAGETFLHPGKSCRIFCDGKAIGVLGEVHPRVLGRFDIGQPVVLLDIDLGAVEKFSLSTIRFNPISRYPDLFRDSAILVDETMPAGKILGVINQVKARFAEEVLLFDVYQGSGIPEGKKSIAFRVRYRSIEKTLTDEEINQAHGKIVSALSREIGAEVR